MTGWFARLMQTGGSHARSPRVSDGVTASTDHVASESPRDAGFDAVVQALRDREDADREAREKRQRWYGQHLRIDSSSGREAAPIAPIRLHRFRTKVPCRMTREARTLLDQLRKQFPGSTVTFPYVASGRQAMMLAGSAGEEPKQIGWVEHCVQKDPAHCNVRHQGLSVETDDGRTLVLRFRYPQTATRVTSRRNVEEGTVSVDFTEIRPALESRPSDKTATPRLVWVTRPPEVETMGAVRNRDYEAFYARLKLEVLSGVWNALSGVLSSASRSQWHDGIHYTVVREPDAANGRIQQTTVDDSGRVVDIGCDRVYDAFPATDILLLYLEADVLADFADICFTLQSLGSADAYFLKEEFFTVIRRFWASSHSLASRYGSDAAAVVRMAQRAVPMPAQAPLLKQDWINLRQSLVDRYGKSGHKAADLVGQKVHRPRVAPSGWPFATFAAGEVNVGLRVVYRQEWRQLAAQRGDVIRMIPPVPKHVEQETTIETTVQQAETTRSLDAIVADAVDAAIESTRWHFDFEGSINTGLRALAGRTDMGLESECRESSRDTSTRLSDIMRRMVRAHRDEPTTSANVVPESQHDSLTPGSSEDISQDDEATTVYSRLQNQYEVLTRPAAIENVVLVAERLPAPSEIDLAWARRHDWILAKVLLDESFRDALATIGEDAADDRPEHIQRNAELTAKRDRLYQHFRANILHYQRNIWQREDPQQRSMRFRKSGTKVPLDWRFELESGGTLTIAELGDRLAAQSVDGQFAAYSSGRDADLDQVIDPAGPIAYYGNYAVYHMRPEFGSDDFFSMLHFFKSPYLRASADTGEMEVADPEEIQLDADQDGTDSFIRERARRIAVDTDSIVVDVIRRVASPPPEIGDAAISLPEAQAGCELILEGVTGVELRLGAPPREGEGGWAIIRAGEERMTCVLVSADLRRGLDIERDAAPARAILVQAEEQRAPRLLAAGAPAANESTGKGLIRARDDGTLIPELCAGDRAAREDDWLIVVRGDDWLRSSEVAGSQSSSAPAHDLL